MQNYSLYVYGNYLAINQLTEYQSLFDYSPSLQQQYLPIVYDLHSNGFQFFEIPYQELSNSVPDSSVIKSQQPMEIPQDLLKNQTEAIQRDKDRNIVSNSLKVFRKYASDSTRLNNSIINSIIAAKQLNYTIQEFGKDLDRRIPRDRNFLGIKFLKSLLSKNSKKQNFSIVIRILLRYYYKKEVYPTVQTSWKILSLAKKKQIASVRKICQCI